MALQLHPYNNHPRVTAKIDRNAHSKEIVSKKTLCIKQLPQKQQRKIMSDSPQISKNGIETIILQAPQQKKRDQAIQIHLGPQRPYHVKWRILRSCQTYSNVSKKCNLCLQEKYFIIFRKDLSSLNKRNELASSCCHRNRLSLKFFRIT